MTPGPREWDAEEYESLARPQDAWGLRILGMLDLKGDETVLEAGCGTGRDTERLLKLLPGGRVIALDGSARMLELLTRRLAGKLDRVDVIQADLAAPLELPSAVDVVFSVAAFHWIQGHAALFRNLAAVLRRGGRLVADCGGFGNVAQVSAAVEQVTGRPGEEGVWNFARTRRAGSSRSRASQTLKLTCTVNLLSSLRVASSSVTSTTSCSAHTWPACRLRSMQNLCDRWPLYCPTAGSTTSG